MTVSAERHLSAARIVVGLLRIVVGFVTRLILRTVAPERWVVAVSRGAWTTPIEAGRRSRILELPDGIEWADPFPVSVAGTDLLFVEEYVRAEHKGRLAVVELDGDRGWRSVTTILDQATHLSYPLVFEWERAWYLMPEQATTGSLELFVATEFPTGWRHHSTVLDRPAADATIAEIDGRWWMFAAIAASPGAAADELHLFHAATPLGPWTAHVANPVVSDVRTARPAGRPFRRDGVWHRVAQDGAVSYGHAMAILRIDRLDLSGYHETVVDTILPRWAPGIIATHTFNADGDLVALDALRRELRIPRRRSS